MNSQGGATVHHIAFVCADIFVTMEALVARSARFVPISINSCDDLLARFDFPEAAVAQMRSLDALFERSAHGEYFHAYSEPFAGRFFFEIVRRSGGYDGYGALNTLARIASKAQRAAAI